MPRGSNVFVVLVAIVAMLLVDFALNGLVVGWAAKRWSGLDKRTLIADLIRLTLLGQVADRAGAVLGLILGALTDPLYPHHGEASYFVPFLVANFVCTSIFIFGLVGWFARARWKLSWKRTCVLGTLAAIFTNPIWALVLVDWLQAQV
jgi:hypothetical protein